MFHPLTYDGTLPKAFTYPFHYTPHPLCIQAVEEVKRYLHRQDEWQEELSKGKMFGVLIVENTLTHALGYLAAFSGILAGKNKHSYFVPPIYDLLQPDGFFKLEEEKISQINREISILETNLDFLTEKENLTKLEQKAEECLKQAKRLLKEAKAIRDKRRSERHILLSVEEENILIRESQFMKAEYKRTERSWKKEITLCREKLHPYEEKIANFKAERKRRSSALQQQLFEQFKILNAQGEFKNLYELFAHTPQGTPPAGAGECAAPKMLQYAYLHGFRPIAMAEFWWGASPRTEIRRHGHFYPACKGKCEPILRHMLQGLNVEKNPLLKQIKQDSNELDIIYEDNSLLIINKPSGMLSVPGKETAISIYDIVREKYPQAEGPLIVHRLDMATSGLLLIAKDKLTHKELQKQFQEQRVKKRYVALLDGILLSDKGRIELPICLNPFDRPRQMVDYQRGKKAITYYTTLNYKKETTKVVFYPLTGRTHQLRVHSAHPEGLNHPIVGDELYGQKAERLYLHAEALEFTHPLTGKIIRVEKKADF